MSLAARRHQPIVTGIHALLQERLWRSVCDSDAMTFALVGTISTED